MYPDAKHYFHDFPFQANTVCCINVTVVAGLFFTHRSSGDQDLARRSCASLGGCSLVALHHTKLAALLPAPLHKQHPPELDLALLAQGRRWQQRGGSRGWWWLLGFRQSQQNLEGYFASGDNFESLSLHSECHDLCWNWKTKLGGSEVQSEELAALLETPFACLEFRY